ncbi:MAG: CoB--CoM heterodisulfide reductase iron-sulfur subunit B family protein [Oscillospiraceae bacterium]|nr:CoB--CoM heterodisulfide reductase iron-sulfur subunit B family protein [Oscillospiraceae bacterium]
MVYSYYPGCTLKTKAKELDKNARLCAQALGFTLEEVEAWQCCGAVYPMGTDEIATKLPAVRALHAADEKGQSIVTLCSACHHVLKRVNEDMRQDKDLRTKVNNYIAQEEEPYTYNGEANVLHYLEVLRDQVGFDNLAAKVKNPLAGRKIGAYYGCMLLRPSSVMQFDDPENPTIFEDFIKAIGAEPVVYPYRNECCGGYISLKEKEMAEEMAGKIADNALSKGAEVLITACPLCLYNMDKKTGETLPTVYFTEFLAEALGIKEE